MHNLKTYKKDYSLDLCTDILVQRFTFKEVEFLCLQIAVFTLKTLKSAVTFYH